MSDSEYNHLLRVATAMASEPKLGDSAWEIKALNLCISFHQYERLNQLCDVGREVRNKLTLVLKQSQSTRLESP